MHIIEQPDPQVLELEAELERLRRIKDHYEESKQRLEQQTEVVYHMLNERGRKSWPLDNHRFTIVQAERVKINEDGLRKALGARAFNKLTIRKVDQKKVTEALTQGEIDPVVVSQYTEAVLNRPSIRITEVPHE
jgi:hypothetical protein